MLQESTVRERFYHKLLKTAEWTAPWEHPLTKIKETNILLALRAVANGLQEGVKGDEPWLKHVHGFITLCDLSGTKCMYRFYRHHQHGIPQCQKHNE